MRKSKDLFFLWKHIYERKAKQFSFTNLPETIPKFPRSLVPCFWLHSLYRQLHQNPGWAMKSLMTCMEVQSWRWEKLQDHWFVTQVYKYLPCCSKFFSSFMLLFKGSQEITQEVSHPHYTRGIVDLGICTFCSKEGLQVVPWAEMPLVAGLEESNLHSSAKVKDTLWKGCSLQCFHKLCLPWNYIHGVFQGIITACAVQVSRADPHHYVSMPFPKDTITQDAEELCSSYLSMCSCHTTVGIAAIWDLQDKSAFQLGFQI